MAKSMYLSSESKSLCRKLAFIFFWLLIYNW